jgi:IS30 family transposase
LFQAVRNVSIYGLSVGGRFYNGLRRINSHYCPKKTNFKSVSKEEVMRVESQLNKRPRKRFDFRTRIEEFNLSTKVEFAT